MPPSNQAAWFDSSGKDLRIAQSPMPVPSPTRILVRNYAIAINPVDWKVQENPSFIKTLPFILGEDIAGEVVDVGSEVTRFKKGDRVISHVDQLLSNDTASGGFQFYTMAPVSTSAVIPDAVSYTDACVLPLALNTAAAGLIGCLKLGYPSLEPILSGRTVLIWGGSASVGALAIQIARATGTQVIAVASKHNHDFVQSLGARAAIDYNSPNVMDKIREAVGTSKLVGVYDAISNEDSYKYTIPIAQELGGGALITVLPPPENLPVDLKTTFVMPIQPDLLGPVWADYITPALQQGKLKCVPPALVVGKGLESVQKGLNVSKAGVSARKVVVELN